MKIINLLLNRKLLGPTTLLYQHQLSLWIKCKDGKEWNGTEYDKNGNIFGKWVNGKYTKQ